MTVQQSDQIPSTELTVEVGLNMAVVHACIIIDMHAL